MISLLWIMERWHSCGAEYSFSPFEYVYDKECLSCRLLFVLCVCCYIWPLYELFAWTCEQQRTNLFSLVCLLYVHSDVFESVHWESELTRGFGVWFVCVSQVCVFVCGGRMCGVIVSLARCMFVLGGVCKSHNLPLGWSFSSTKKRKEGSAGCV